MRARVQSSIDALDFRPNGAARVLRRNVSSLVAYVCGTLAEPVQAQLASAVSTVTEANGLWMTVSTTNGDPASERAIIESLVAHQVDGIILWPTLGNLAGLNRITHGTPIVCLDQTPRGLAADVVLSDNLGGARTAVDYLVGRGHTRIGVVGDPLTLSTQRERLEGYRAALRDAGISPDPRLVFHGEMSDYDRLAKQLAYWQVIPSPPTAVFSASSLATGSLLRVLPDSTPLDIVAFDDFPFADVLRGGTSVVAQDVETLGRIGAETLLSRLRGHKGEPTTVRVATHFIERESWPRPP